MAEPATESAQAPKKKSPILSASLDELKTYDPSDLVRELRESAPEGTERVMDPVRKKLVQIVPLTQKQMQNALAAVKENDDYERFDIRLKFPTDDTWEVSLGVKKQVKVGQELKTAYPQSIGGNRLIPIEEFKRSIYTLVSRYEMVRRGVGKKYGGLGSIGEGTVEV